jgi:uncharacterized membrane protein SpoIIM required for sporulation
MVDGQAFVTPLQFETLYQADWRALEEQVQACLQPPRQRVAGAAPVHGERLAALYRRGCEQLALARERAYPAHIVDRLERVTSDAHQLIYQRREFGLGRLRDFILRDFPRSVRAHARYVWVAAALFLIPTLVVGWIVYLRPELVLSVVDASTAASFEGMYSGAAESLGRKRNVDSDWMMFGYYIRNNIGVAFQCFGGGLFLGVGSIFFLFYNGAFGGAIGGYLTERGLSANFYSFVVTHSAFELTAIVLSGAAGLRIGHALLAPGRLTRRASLVRATAEVAPVIYGFVVMLLIAAAIEAFWSSAVWLPQPVKYSVAAACWVGVLTYFFWQGRREA